MEEILALPLRKQADCVLIAVELCLPLWRRWCQENRKPDLSGELVDCFRRWFDKQETKATLWRTAKEFEKDLPKDLAEEADPTAGYVGTSLFAVVMIALNRCRDVHPDFVASSIFYAAAARCGVGIWDAMKFDTKRLTPCELGFIDEWWGKCRLKYPELPPPTTRRKRKD
jgi:hypothetical protein